MRTILFPLFDFFWALLARFLAFRIRVDLFTNYSVRDYPVPVETSDETGLLKVTEKVISEIKFVSTSVWPPIITLKTKQNKKLTVFWVLV